MINNKSDKFNYIIFHKKCFDGYSSFFLFMNTNLYLKNSIIFPDTPNTNSVPPNIEGKNVIIMDVAYNVNIIKKYLIWQIKFYLLIIMSV